MSLVFRLRVGVPLTVVMTVICLCRYLKRNRGVLEYVLWWGGVGRAARHHDCAVSGVQDHYLHVGGSRIHVHKYVPAVGPSKFAVVYMTDPPITTECAHPFASQLLDALGGRWDVVVAEPVSFGHSRPCKSFNYTGIEFTEHLSGMLDGLGYRGYVLFAPCVNAYAAMRVASQRSDVKCLVISQAPSFEQGIQWAIRMDGPSHLLTRKISPLLVWARAYAVIAGWLRVAIPRRGDYEETGTESPDSDTAVDQGGPLRQQLTQMTQGAVGKGAAFPLGTAIQQIFFSSGAKQLLHGVSVPCPTLVVWGGCDRSHSHSDPESIYPWLQQYERVDFEGAGHFPELQQPILFSKTMADFVHKHMDSTNSKL